MDDVVFVHVSHALADLAHVMDTILLCQVMGSFRQPLKDVATRQATKRSGTPRSNQGDTSLV